MIQSSLSTHLAESQVATSILCEYTFRGNYDNAWNGPDDWLCCPHGTSPVVVKGCPAS
jgi:hypothetical protein